jgi:hypothetical protein
VLPAPHFRRGTYIGIPKYKGQRTSCSHFIQCAARYHICSRNPYLAPLMPLETITKLFQRFTSQTRTHDMPDTTNITYGRVLNRPSVTRRVMKSAHQVGRKVPPRRKIIIPNASALENRAGTEGKSETDSQDANAETLRRHTRHRVPTDRAKGLMSNGSWDVHLRTPSRKRKKPRRIPANGTSNPNVRNSEDA